MAAPTGTMTFVELQDEVLSYRFKEAQRGSVKHWLNQRYGWVYAAAAWPFKSLCQANLAVTAGTPRSSVTSVTDVLRVVQVYNENGDELTYMTPLEFQQNWPLAGYPDLVPQQPISGTPEAFTMLGDFGTTTGIYLGPMPDASATYVITYERKLGHFTGADAWVAGVMSADTDYPVFDAAYHYMLVMGATATGLKMVNDPTWEALEDEFRAMVIVMEQELLPANRGRNLQFGTMGTIMSEG